VVANCNEKLSQWKFQSTKAACPPQQRRGKYYTHMYIPILEVMLYALEMLEGMRRVLLCMLEAAEGELCLLEVIRFVLSCILKVVEGALCLLEMPEPIRFVLLCMLEAVESGFCLWRCWT